MLKDTQYPKGIMLPRPHATWGAIPALGARLYMRSEVACRPHNFGRNSARSSAGGMAVKALLDQEAWL